MSAHPGKRKRLRRALFAAALALVVLGVSGCETLGFYGQAIKGQGRILIKAKPIRKVLADPRTPDRLRGRLQLVLDLRAFAQQQLRLPVDGHYEKYVDLHRRCVTWNVEAAPEFSLAAKTWWYPFVGRLAYRGYFSERGAQRYAARLRKQGYDVHVAGVQAYSTLGWFKDPALNTFIFQSDAGLAEVIFHELGHERVFAHGDTDFNEAFATTVGEEGARRWLQAQGDKAALETYLAGRQRTRQFVQLIMQTRARLRALYGDELNEWGGVTATAAKAGVPRAELRREKQRLLEDLRAEYPKLKAQWGGSAEYDAWFARELNNAKLNSVAAYYELVPAFEQLLKDNGGDLEKFYRAAERLAELPKKGRHQQLQHLARNSLSRVPG
jgi:predicted aminopeptidase